jgi:hypothetical protein
MRKVGDFEAVAMLLASVVRRLPRLWRRVDTHEIGLEQEAIEDRVPKRPTGEKWLLIEETEIVRRVTRFFHDLLLIDDNDRTWLLLVGRGEVS